MPAHARSTAKGSVSGNIRWTHASVVRLYHIVLWSDAVFNSCAKPASVQRYSQSSKPARDAFRYDRHHTRSESQNATQAVTSRKTSVSPEDETHHP